ncbi:pilus assembly protein TadE [Xylanimonas oleitrophica]|uniref:Pilus assembly protein TadE n=1 Tax=Xylanimonas oleitrophica TaxID=2607479 RepID=A0A2W5WKH5_9MICO|nr:TadE family type IV pilus minor pilin [Xylanimonas oleitrophica]PZR51757.1 pilus assembly protein TadE [Xylanimonas oleitrophica]
MTSATRRGALCSRRPTDTERGAVTAELAVGMPVVVLLLVAVLTLAAASSAQMRALDAARAGARALAVGEDEAQVREVVTRLAGPGAELGLLHDGPWVTVHVSRPVAAGWLAHVPLRAGGEATAWLEP